MKGDAKHVIRLSSCKASLRSQAWQEFSAASRCSEAVFCKFFVSEFTNLRERSQEHLEHSDADNTPSAKKMNAIISQITPQTVMRIALWLIRCWVLTSRWTTATDLSECTRVRVIYFTANGIILKRVRQTIVRCERKYTPTTSHRTYIQGHKR